MSDTNPPLLPVNLAAQFLPGTFEYAVDLLHDHAIDMSRFDARSRNDTTPRGSFGVGGRPTGATD